jgi:hypothetical protein
MKGQNALDQQSHSGHRGYMAADSSRVRNGSHRNRGIDDFIDLLLEDGAGVSPRLRSLCKLIGIQRPAPWARLETMRFNLLLLVPYVILFAVVIFCSWVIQRDQDQIRAFAVQQCVAERRMYAVISDGLRTRAKIVRSPADAHELLLEAQEMERISGSLENCTACQAMVCK